MYLLDTNVLSELRKLESNNCHLSVKQWASTCKPSQFFTSVICIFEVERGILQVARKDAAQAKRLRHWFETRLIPGMQDRLLPVTHAITSKCAQLHVPDPKPEMDALIAATASVHDLTLVTRNTRDFEPMGVRCINPWESGK
jgi:toxin FitB